MLNLCSHDKLQTLGRYQTYGSYGAYLTMEPSCGLTSCDLQAGARAWTLRKHARCLTRSVSDRQNVQWKNSKIFQDIPLAANAVEFPVATNSIEEFHLLSSSHLTTFFGICLKGSWLANRPDNGMLDAGHKLKILGARMTVGICWSYWANVANRRNYISWDMCFMS